MPYALLLTAGEREGEMFPIQEGRTLTLGRDTANDIRLLDRKLSRIHCQVDLVGGSVRVTDLNSTNGTMVNGARIETETTVTQEDEIEVGLTRIRVVEVTAEGAAAAEMKPVRHGKTPPPAPAATSATMARCEECGKQIPAELIASGKVRTVGSRYYCSACSSFNEEPAAPQPMAEMEEDSGPVHEPLPIGKEVAGVRILSLIGEGRLGPLYKGEQISMDRLVALKVLNVAEVEWAQQYLQAVYASGQLVHANIALIFDTGDENGQFYVVREYVEGQSLQERMVNHEAMPLSEAHGIITQVAYALEHAFERHLCHGSLSPRKVILGPRDAVKVTGFGLPLTPPPGRTAAAHTWHALPYMAPERVRAEAPPDFSADVYSAVGIFYHLLTGRPPFTGSTRERIEQRILTQQPRPLKEFMGQPSPTAQKIIDRGLSKDTRSRYHLPRELLFDLEETLRREI